MAQGWCAKNIAKAKQNGIRRHGNTFKGVIVRGNGSTYAEKAQAFEEYKRLLRREDASENFVPVVLVGRDGTGLPSEGYDCEKYNVAVVIPADEIKKPRNPKGTSQGNAKVSSKGAMVAPAKAGVAKWSRRGGFATR